MRKFFVLLRKEIKELLTLRMLLPIIIMAGIFSGLGHIIGSERTKLEKPWPLAVIDQSHSKLSKELIDHFPEQNISVSLLSEDDINKAVAIAQHGGSVALLVIPRNFEADFNQDQKIQFLLYTFLRGFSMAANFGAARIENITANINEFLSDKRLALHNANVTPDFFRHPAAFNHFTVLGTHMAPVNFNQVMGMIQSQTTFVPIVLFLVIVLAAQMVASAIASEKENKTLEILLSSPVDRRTIIFTKILAAAIVALLFSGIYIVGWSSYMSNLSGGNVPENAQAAQALQSLGVIVSPSGYALLGLSLFLSILCALSIAIMLGIMAEDVKGVQAVTTPLMILVMIPYFLTLFVDIPSASPFLRGLLYVIPFSHTFLAMQNVMMQDYLPIFCGILYQILAALFFIFLASKIFTSDRVLTLKFRLKKNT